MNNIRVDIRLRPIRFEFLVRPDDDKNVLEIFRINTCLWGGMFNPIIPMFKSVPSWLEEEGFHFQNPKQMISDYLDFFEPDFPVEAEEGLAEGFGFDPERVRKLADMLDRKTKRIDELVATEQRKIELLKEYRQSLISEAVTGKIDVRDEV